MPKTIIFMGSHEVSIPLLEALKDIKDTVISGVISQPDKPVGRGCKMTPTKISDWASRNNIPLLKPVKPDVDTSTWMLQQGCDLVLVMAYGHILRKNILELAPCGIYNFHASILPKYRGASPIESAILNGETETGVTLMEIVQEMDAGDIVDVEKITIDIEENAIDIYKKLSEACVPLIIRNIHNLINGTVVKAKQDSSLATFTKKFTKDDMKLNFQNNSATALFNQTRAFAARCNCYFEHNGEILKVGKCATSDIKHNITAGEISRITNESVDISTICGTFRILELQKSGGKMSPIKEFLNGYKMKIGEMV